MPITSILRLSITFAAMSGLRKLKEPKKMWYYFKNSLCLEETDSCNMQKKGNALQLGLMVFDFSGYLQGG